MLKTWQFVVLMLCSVLAAALVIANMVLFTQNRAEQQQINGRQQFIQQSLQLESLYQQLIKGVAELAARQGDEQLKSVLSSQGITFSRNPTPAAGSSQAAGSAASPAKK